MKSILNPPSKYVIPNQSPYLIKYTDNNIMMNKMSKNLISYCIWLIGVHSMMFLQRLNLTTVASTHKINFLYAFEDTPSYTLSCIVIESVSVSAGEFQITHQAELKNTSIRMNCTVVGGMVEGTDFVELVLVVGDEVGIELGITQTNHPTFNLTFAHTYEQYKLIIFAHSVPFYYTVVDERASRAEVTLTHYHGNVSSEGVWMGYMLVDRDYLINNIWVGFEQITSTSADYFIHVDDEGYLDPDDENTALAMMGYVDGVGSNVVVLEYADHSHEGANIIAMGYKLPTSITALQSIVITFNPNYINCPVGSYLKYITPYQSVPVGCGQCDKSCLSCTTSPIDECYTSEDYCTTCSELRYLKKASSDDSFGECVCLEGLVMSSQGKCVPCSFDCLSFDVQFIRTSSKPQFLLIFSSSDLTHQLPLDENLQVMLEGEIVNVTVKELRPGSFLLEMDESNFEPCEEECEILFQVLHPECIFTSTKTLTQRYSTLFIRNFYLVGDQLPEQISQAFLISSLLIGATAAAGQTSLIKMLFEIEQMIQFHKYLNLDIPVVFKEFVEELSMFKFLDFASVLPFDLNAEMRNLAANGMDNKGPTKAVYYQNGANFYKNIIPAVLSFFFIILINVIIFFLFKLLPCQLFKFLSEKIKIRWMITLSDMIETLVVPTSLFFVFQLQYILMNFAYSWIYFLSLLITAIVMVFPFIVIIYVENCKKTNKIQRELFQDLFQDTKLSSRVSFLSYIIAFMRKFMFAMFLSPILPGLIQVNMLLVLNILYFLFIIYVIANRVFTSGIKILIKVISTLSLILLELIILIYNINYSNIDQMIEMGFACTYLAIISTIAGLIEVIVKIGELIFQKVTQDDSKTKQTIICNVGKPLDYVYEEEQNEQGGNDEEKSEKNSEIITVTDGYSSKKQTNYQDRKATTNQQDLPIPELYKRHRRGRNANIGNILTINKRKPDQEQSSMSEIISID